MVHVLADEKRLASFLPRLTELAEQRRVLIVIDNIESLLTEGGQWRDDRWGKVVAALSGHKGRGRLILTSRRVPATGTGGLGWRRWTRCRRMRRCCSPGSCRT